MSKFFIVFASACCLCLLANLGWANSGSGVLLPPYVGQLSSSQPNRESVVFSGNLLSNGGQNPVVKIRWGDEDRGTAVNPSYAWDNEVLVCLLYTSPSPRDS